MAGFLVCILKFCKIRWNEVRTSAAVDGLHTHTERRQNHSSRPSVPEPVVESLWDCVGHVKARGPMDNVREKIKEPQSAGVTEVGAARLKMIDRLI